MKPSTRINLPHPGMRGHGRAAISGRRRHKHRAWEKCLVPRMRASTLQPAEGAHRSRRRSPALRQSWCHGRPPRRARQPRAPQRASAARRRSPRRGRRPPPQCAALPGRRRPPPHAPAPGRTGLSARLLSLSGAAKLFSGYEQELGHCLLTAVLPLLACSQSGLQACCTSVCSAAQPEPLAAACAGDSNHTRCLLIKFWAQRRIRCETAH